MTPHMTFRFLHSFPHGKASEISLSREDLVFGIHAVPSLRFHFFHKATMLRIGSMKQHAMFFCLFRGRT